MRTFHSSPWSQSSALDICRALRLLLLFLGVLGHEAAVESFNAAQDAVELVLGRQKRGPEVPRARRLPEAAPRDHHHAGGVHELKAVKLVGGDRFGHARGCFGDELGWQVDLQGRKSMEETTEGEWRRACVVSREEAIERERASTRDNNKAKEQERETNACQKETGQDPLGVFQFKKKTEKKPRD